MPRGGWHWVPLMGFFVNGMLGRCGALMREMYSHEDARQGEEQSQVLARKLLPLKSI